LQPAEFAHDDDWRLDAPGWRVVAEDGTPVGYDFTSDGLCPLPPYAVYENSTAFPRAFVVPEARPLPERARTGDAERDRLP
jgi:hypothetical protein